MHKNKKRVLVAMSGGVDSSVALIKVLEMGYDAIGVTLKLWENRDKKTNKVIDSDCNSLDAVNGAKLVCDRLGVHHYTLNFIDLFKNEVVTNFSDEYFSGRTPNPCIRCNSIVKWDALIKQLDVFEADMIATGHYARIKKDENEYQLCKGIDEIKDQSYMLWHIDQNLLDRTLLPIGELTKDEVREYAKLHNLETSNIPDSQDLCFVMDGDYRNFLNEFMPEKMEKITEGDIEEENGTVVGHHSGFTDYTIGQRKGLKLSYPEPRYVKKINRYVKPKFGFNVIATANTKGQGSDDGKFIGTNILNEAFLERFPVTFEQEYPTAKTEQKIVATKLKSVGKSDIKFATNLVTWADVIRRTYKDGGVDEIISTRRLVHIAEAYAIFKSKMKAIEVCTNRFDDDTKNSFVDLYTKVDAGVSAEQILEDKKKAEEAEILSEEKDSNDSEDDEEDITV